MMVLTREPPGQCWKDACLAKVDVNHRFAQGLTALHFAAMHNHVDMVRMLLYAGALAICKR
eukprot:1398414-Amphidinium_carterae.1